MLNRVFKAGAVGLILAMLMACQGGREAHFGGRAEVDTLQLRAVSNRADLVSGHDALLEVSGVNGVEGLRVSLNGEDVTARFKAAGEARLLGLIEGLVVGDNLVTARLGDGPGRRLTLRNHPPEGPIFSGPHLQPWPCTTADHGLGEALDSNCNAEIWVRWQYRNRSGGFSAYDPDAPPADSNIATTSNDAGETVRYIVRRERGTLNRGIYDWVVLHDPDNDPPMTPWTPPRGWNRKFVFSYGSGCAPGYGQNEPEDPMLHPMLSRGYAVAVSSILKFGNSCNHVTAAETTMMIKERMIEMLGEDRYTIGNSCSGGAEAQNTISDNYPGLLDGTRPECTFADGWTPAITGKADCQLLVNYFMNISPQLWPALPQQSAVVGADVSMCYEMLAFGSGPQDWNPSTGCGLPEELMYHPQDNPQGARCTLQDYNVNYLGRREADGFANKVLDDVGVQWGLHALQQGLITTAQFVDLNVKIGSFDIDWNHVPERTAGDLIGIQRMYDSGQLIWGENQKLIPSIDTRANNQFDFHSNVHREVVRHRVLRSVGSIATQVYWLEPLEVVFGLPTPPQSEYTLIKMDEWLANIEADEADLPREQIVARNRPPDVRDGDCYLAGQRLLDNEPCEQIYTEQKLPRIVAGAPPTADVLKCQLKPFDPADADYVNFGIQFSAAEIAQLETAFPQGVCDWTRPGVGQGPPVGYWLDFSHGPDGVPLGEPPRAEVF